MSTNPLLDKIVLITGASSGIGAATAKEIAKSTDGNVRLILAARRIEKIELLTKRLEAEYKSIKIYPCQWDVSKLETIAPFVKSLPEEFASIDVLVNNAGLALGRDNIGEILEADMMAMFQTNVLGLFALTQAVLPIMKAKDYGDIINLGSVAGLDPYPGGGVYCATKASVNAFSEVLRKELISTKIRVIEIDPGMVETEFSEVRFKGDIEKAKAVYAGSEPLYGKDIADVIVFCLTRARKMVLATVSVFPNNQASSRDVYKPAT